MTLSPFLIDEIASIVTITSNDPSQMHFAARRLQESFQREFARRGGEWVAVSERQPKQEDSFGPNQQVCWLMIAHPRHPAKVEIASWESFHHRKNAKKWCSLAKLTID